MHTYVNMAKAVSRLIITVQIDCEASIPLPCTRLKKINQKYILRNYMTEIAIRRVQDEYEYSAIDNWMKLLSNPYYE